MTTTFDALLKSLNPMSNMKCHLLNVPLANELERLNIWFNAFLLEGSSDNPLWVLKDLIADPVRDDPIYPDEFESVTGLEAKYMYSPTVDDLPEDEVFRAAGKLFICYLAAGRNQVREVIRDRLPYACDVPEGATQAVEAWRARRAARATAVEPLTIARAA